MRWILSCSAVLMVALTSASAFAYACPEDYERPFKFAPAAGGTIVGAGESLAFLAATGDCRGLSLPVEGQRVAVRVGQESPDNLRTVAPRLRGAYLEMVFPEPGLWFVEATYRTAVGDLVERVLVLATDRPRARRLRLEESDVQGSHLILRYRCDDARVDIEGWALPWLARSWRGASGVLRLRVPAGSYEWSHGERLRVKLGAPAARGFVVPVIYGNVRRIDL
ncbi:MAG: hypothetical protein AAGF12_16280 [Myxococcota bacterium]